MKIDRHHDDIFQRRLDYPFWEGLQIGELRIQRCMRCDTWIMPAEWRCGTCGSYEMSWPSVPFEGRVYTWSRTNTVFDTRFKSIVPYVSVLVELPQAGNIRLYGLLRGPEQGLKIGSRLSGFIEPPDTELYDLPMLRWRLDTDPQIGCLP